MFVTGFGAKEFEKILYSPIYMEIIQDIIGEHKIRPQICLNMKKIM